MHFDAFFQETTSLMQTTWGNKKRFPRNLQVPTVIYAEIPEANAWLTGLGVVLGVGQFGLAGVVLGPLLASVPLICCSDWDVSVIFC